MSIVNKLNEKLNVLTESKLAFSDKFRIEGEYVLVQNENDEYGMNPRVPYAFKQGGDYTVQEIGDYIVELDHYESTSIDGVVRYPEYVIREKYPESDKDYVFASVTLNPKNAKGDDFQVYIEYQIMKFEDVEPMTGMTKRRPLFKTEKEFHTYLDKLFLEVKKETEKRNKKIVKNKWEY